MGLLGPLIFGYLLGSIPFGLLLTRAAGLGDVRKIGSGSIGATNVLRTGNKWLAVATVMLDGLKGFVAVLLAHNFSGFDGGILAGLGAFLGHIFPVWLGFRGGKGVATFIGVLFAMAWPLGVLFCLTWLAVAVLSRYSSLSGLVATAVTTLAIAFGSAALSARGYLEQGNPVRLAAVSSLMALLLFWKHRDNISRLLAGTESRIGAKG